jgi:hypothetical protein
MDPFLRKSENNRQSLHTTHLKSLEIAGRRIASGDLNKVSRVTIVLSKDRGGRSKLRKSCRT